MRVLAIGDVVGKSGRDILKSKLKGIIKEQNIDMVIANGENAAAGNGLTYPVMNELYHSGIDVITMGNHVWGKREILDFIEHEHNLIRPANFPENTPGKGSTLYRYKNICIGVVNVLGRVYMHPTLDCPFKTVEQEIEKLKKHTKIILVDFHAEASSEKMALGWHMDGKASAVFGTHTHVQTADERVFPKGTAYITDLGMTGPYNGILGVDREIIINKFLTQMPARFELSYDTAAQLNGVVIEIDENTGKSKKIKRIQIIENNL